MYICEFGETKASEPLDYVEKAIIQTKSFWVLFGLGAEGYAECERAFCVRGKNFCVKGYQRWRICHFMKKCWRN